MQRNTPFRLGRFLVDREGRLLLGTPDATPTLHLHWRGVPVCAQLQPGAAPGADGRLALSAIIGRVPSTASHTGVTMRSTALAQLHDLAAAMGDGWRLALLPDHRASIAAARDLKLPASAAALLAEITCFLLGLAPYLDLLGESGAGIEPAGSPMMAGTANT